MARKTILNDAPTPKQAMAMIKAKLSSLPSLGYLDSHPPRGCVEILASGKKFYAFEFDAVGPGGEFFGCECDENGEMPLDPDLYMAFFVLPMREFGGVPAIVGSADLRRTLELGGIEPIAAFPIDAISARVPLRRGSREMPS